MIVCAIAFADHWAPVVSEWLLDVRDALRGKP